MRAITPKLTTIFAVVAVLTLLAACGGSSKPAEAPATQTTVAELSPDEILARASTQLAATQTVAFNLAVTGETFVDLNDTIQLLNAKGYLVRPNRVYTEFKIKIAKSITLSMKLITIENRHWTSDLITGKWGAAPEEFGYDPRLLFDNQNGIGPVMDRITNATKLPNDTVQGRETFHMQASVSHDIIGALASNSMLAGDVGVEIWIDVQNFNVLQLKLSESTAVTDHQPAVWVLSLTNQDQPTTVDAPDAPFSVSSPVASPQASPLSSPIATPGTSA